ncbi:MAG: hypothetical protein ABI459_01715 [Deltaproteobacteria bacterium]
MANSAVSDLLDLLARERVDLMSGNLSQIGETAATKEKLLNRLPFESLSSDALVQLQMTSRHNARLMAAALSGIKSVAQRLKTQDSPATTYDPMGRLSSLSVRTSASFTRA